MALARSQILRIMMERKEGNADAFMEDLGPLLGQSPVVHTAITTVASAPRARHCNTEDKRIEPASISRQTVAQDYCTFDCTATEMREQTKNRGP